MIKNWIMNFNDWVWELIGWRIKYFFISVKNIIRWFPIIWKDRDWDSSFIFEILKFKLQNQAKYIGREDRHIRAQLDVKRMLVCCKLIDRINNDYYGMEYMDYCVNEFNWLECEQPGYKQLEIKEISNNFEDYFKKYPRSFNYCIESNKIGPLECDKIIAMKIAQYNQKKASKLLFKILEENIQMWWD